jgi:hypothetical protein
MTKPVTGHGFESNIDVAMRQMIKLDTAAEHSQKRSEQSIQLSGHAISCGKIHISATP